MAPDLRTFIQQLRASKMLVHVATQVDPSYEISAILRRMEADSPSPAVLFENVAGTGLPVLGNLFTDSTRLGLALGTDRSAVGARFAERCTNPLPVQRVDGGPARQRVLFADEVDVTTQLPQIVHSVGDAGAYITSAVTIARDPDTAMLNAGIYRLQIAGPRKLRINPGPGSDLLAIWERHEARQQPLDVVMCVGHHPALLLASQYRSSSGISELDMAGALLGEPLRMMGAQTVAIDVPADAEILLEGRILPGQREKEGPFIELAQFENGGMQNPIVELTALSMRADAIFHDVFSAHPDHNNIGVPAREADLLMRARSVCPSVAGVALPASAAARFTAYVSIDEPKVGMGRNVAAHLLGASPSLKLVVLTNTDVDIYDERAVQWAVAMRVQADRDVIVLPGMFVGGLDPSGRSPHSTGGSGAVNSKWFIDATVPSDASIPERRDLPRSLWENLDLGRYLVPPT